MSTDPSLSTELRRWRDTHCTFNGATYVLPNGSDFETVRLAIQAAWSAGAFDLVLEIADQSSIGTVMCLRCTQRGVFTDPVTSPWGKPHPVWFRLCTDCARRLVILSAYEPERKRLEAAKVGGASP